MTDRVGQRLGNYTIIKLLGQGGFAEVYLGEHLYLKSQAAIKVLQTRLSSTGDMDSFLTEAQTIARLSHPNIIRVMDFGVDAEVPYLVMDYAPNGTLRQRHTKGIPVPLATILPYVKQIADALQYAHDEHLIHRDIKPENMLIGRRNEILLSDFGIALVAQSSRYQGTQDVIGTVAYMSPEQIQGKPRPASDQYSLGVVVYEWLTGERPFHGSFTEMCTQHMFAQPPLMSEKLALISPPIERVVMTALAKDPKQRFESIQTFAQALEQVNTGTDRSALTEKMQESMSYKTELMPPSTTSQPYTTASQTPSEATPARPAMQNIFQTSTPFTNPSAAQPANSTSQGHQSEQATRDKQLPNPLSTLHSMSTEARTDLNSAQPGQFNQNAATPSQPDNIANQQRMVLPSPYQIQRNENQSRPQSQFSRQQPSQPEPPQPQHQFSPQQPYSSNIHGQQAAPMQPPSQQYPGQAGFQQPHGQPYSPQQPSRNPQGPPATPYSSQQPYLKPNEFQQSASVKPPEAQYERKPYPTNEPPSPKREEQRQPQRSTESFDEGWGLLGTWKWPILATLVGIVLFCVIHNFNPALHIPLLNHELTFVLIIPLFFGAAFGPWVGLLVGIGGVLCGNLIYQADGPLTLQILSTSHGANIWWAPLLVNGAAGLLAGLSMVRRRKYPSIGSSTRAIVLGAMGLAASIGYVLYNLHNLQRFQYIGLVTLLNLAISFVLLLVYSVLVRLIDPIA